MTEPVRFPEHYMNNIEQQNHYHGYQEIYGDSSGRDADVSQYRSSIVGWIYGNRFCSADNKRSAGNKVSHDGYGDRPERVDMGNRIQRDATLSLGGVVSKKQGNETVRHFMEHDAFHQKGDYDNFFYHLQLLTHKTSYWFDSSKKAESG